ncbi:hypothetical protein BJ085DRAFT_32329 [Dimargaris cristalligena]|uniref:DUF4219 domain-containing protein n=1 Tax=Dimargaris cristalligena TaxID=215637 RepID=A0A4P9ZLX1_9FUNG|nr:hypothetical protein BJ085DRAFT_32329 [Dimargaris cristalligena]|eukprot:RKP33220.1 hypothetical protein BJ085DRAFT_32329 [Dimargaris cristalligena]
MRNTQYDCTIPVFEETNYKSWASYMEIFLEMEDLWEVTTESLPSRKKKGDDPMVDEKYHKDREATFVICTSLPKVQTFIQAEDHLNHNESTPVALESAMKVTD